MIIMQMILHRAFQSISNLFSRVIVARTRTVFESHQKYRMDLHELFQHVSLIFQTFEFSRQNYSNYSIVEFGRENSNYALKDFPTLCSWH